ncbi:hypothetical protein BH20VER1_BH20VER1_00640 [soil metagenome]
MIAMLVLAGVALAQAATTPDFTAAEALQNVGKEATVTDKVERVNKASGGNTFMSLGSRDRDKAFTIFIASSDAEAVGDMTKYEGKTVTVTGRITAFKDKPQIQVTSASQITVKEDESDRDKASPSPSPKK